MNERMSYDENAQLNKCDLSVVLDAGRVSRFWTAGWRLFHTHTKTENARSRATGFASVVRKRLCGCRGSTRIRYDTIR